MEVQFLVFFLNLGEGDGDENDDNNFKVLLYFEAAIAGADPNILKREALYVGHHGWQTKKIVGFTRSTYVHLVLD